MLTFSIKRRIRRFPVVVARWTSTKCTKSVLQVQSYCFAHKTNCFFTLSLSSSRKSTGRGRRRRRTFKIFWNWTGFSFSARRWPDSSYRRWLITSLTHFKIIPKEKTMKIITLTVVWISDTNYHNILGTLSLNFSKNHRSFMKLYQKRHLMFHPISRHLEVGLKKTGPCLVF